MIKYHPKPGASWLRYTPRHLYCRSCGVEVRSRMTPLGYGMLALIYGLLALAAFVVFGQRSWVALAPYAENAMLACALLCLPLSLIFALWGIRFHVVGGSDGE